MLLARRRCTTPEQHLVRQILWPDAPKWKKVKFGDLRLLALIRPALAFYLRYAILWRQWSGAGSQARFSLLMRR